MGRLWGITGALRKVDRLRERGRLERILNTMGESKYRREKTARPKGNWPDSVKMGQRKQPG